MKKNKWKGVILYVEVSVANLIFLLIIELVETPRWTEEEMEIAKQGKEAVITLWLSFLTFCYHSIFCLTDCKGDFTLQSRAT